MKKLLITILSLCIFHAQAGNTQSTSALNRLLDQYLKVKNALINSEDVSRLSAEFAQQARAITPKDLNETDQNLWSLHSASIIKEADNMAATHQVETQRKHFSFLSAHFHSVVKSSTITRTLYYQFCPMYNNNKGAYWISEIKNIRNPYYGSKMMTCGSTKETLH